MPERPASGFRVRRGALSGVVAVEAETDRSFARHMHEEFGIGLILRGAQASASGRGPVEAGPGNVITVNPGEVHDGRPIGHAGRRWRMLYLDPQLVRDGAGDVLEADRAFEFADPVLSDVRIAAEVTRLLAAATTPSAVMETEARLLILLSVLMPARPQRTACGPIARARQRIDDDPAAAQTLAMLAAEAGLSRFQLVRGFARETGLTPHAYLLQKRLGLARRLLLQGMPPAEAAAVSGFADQSHMTRLFARCFGVTPGQFARRAG